MDVHHLCIVLLLIHMLGSDAAHLSTHTRQKRQQQEFQQLNNTQIAEALDHHNALRRLEGASNMFKLYWSNDLAIMATQWASLCQWRHGQPDNMIPYKFLGQNLYTGSESLNITRAQQLWYNEKNYYIFDNRTCIEAYDINMERVVCGHYTQMVWDDTRELGCGYFDCDRLVVNENTEIAGATYYVCNYGPGGNIVGDDLYEPGTPCTMCENYACDDGLCDWKQCSVCEATSYTCNECPENTPLLPYSEDCGDMVKGGPFVAQPHRGYHAPVTVTVNLTAAANVFNPMFSYAILLSIDFDQTNHILLTPADWLAADRLQFTAAPVPAALQNRAMQVYLLDNNNNTQCNLQLQFGFYGEPEITNIYPRNSILSGGISLTVEGSNFDVVQEAQLIITMIWRRDSGDEVTQFYGECPDIEADKVECITPNINLPEGYTPPQPHRGRRKRAADKINNEIIEFQVDLIFDDFEPTIPSDIKQLRVYYDPSMERFDPLEYIYKGKTDIIVKGQDMDLGASVEDYVIKVGVDGVGTVSQLLSNALHFRPPKKKPDVIDDDFTREGKPRVQITVGSLNFFIGYLIYEESPTNWLVIGAAAGGGLLLLIIIIGIACCCSNSRKREPPHHHGNRRAEQKFVNDGYLHPSGHHHHHPHGFRY